MDERKFIFPLIYFIFLVDLPAGRWAVTISGGSGACDVEVRVQSSLQIYTGYVTDSRNDFPYPYAFSNSSKPQKMANKVLKRFKFKN